MPHIEAETITIKFDGKDITLYREEILDNPEFGDIFLLFERTGWELADLVYEQEKLNHALHSMKLTLQEVAVRYIRDKYAGEPDES